jgi:hypothetical protein
MNDELERMWKEATMAKCKVLSMRLSGGSEEKKENSARIAGLWADI